MLETNAEFRRQLAAERIQALTADWGHAGERERPDHAWRRRVAALFRTRPRHAPAIDCAPALRT